MRRVGVGIAIVALLFAAACSNRARNVSVKDQVSHALHQAGLNDVSVDQDTGRRLVTLQGNVKDEGLKQQATQLAQNAAPGWAVSNEIGVLPQGDESAARAVSSNLDGAIEKTYKATLIANKLDNAGIRYHAKNGVLTLNGTVDNPVIRDQAQKLAGTVPNVSEVVNKLDVRHQTAQTEKP